MIVRASLLCLGLLAIVACSRPRQLPATLTDCNAQADGIAANLRNDSDRPIKSVSVSADFYSNFRFVRTDGTVVIPGGLNPGDSKDVSFQFAGPSNGASGRASRCLATHILYLDGATADLPAEAR